MYPSQSQAMESLARDQFANAQSQCSGIGQTDSRLSQMQPQREREVPATINRITDAAVNLQELIGTLAKRLAPVRSTSLPKTGSSGEKSVAVGPGTDIAQSMQPALGALSTTAALVQQILDELEI